MDQRSALGSIDGYEEAARAALDEDVFDYFATGANDERTLVENIRAFDRWVLRPRVMRRSSSPDLSIELFGEGVRFPVLVAPVAYQDMADPEGEIATATGAGAVGTITVVPGTAHHELEAIAAAGDGAKWWQLYLFNDRSMSEEIVRRASAAGYRAICLTADAPTRSRRGLPVRGGSRRREDDAPAYEADVSWDDIGWLKGIAPDLPLLVKGVLTPDDAELAVRAGADGIVVSNQGGRQLDGCAGTLDVLPEVAGAVGDDVPVLMDGGVRRGTDVLKALALGATATLVGRPAMWGLAVGGAQGVADALSILRDEFEDALAMSGCPTPEDISRELVAPAPWA